MHANGNFWEYFNTEAGPRLAHRETTFRAIFQHLDTLPGRLNIVETGCARVAGNWAGDGQSTVLFDRYVCARDQDSACISVDLSAQSVAQCQSLVSERVRLVQDDSVHFLSQLAARMQQDREKVDLLYLDSYDLDMVYWMPSAMHHLKELAAMMRCIDQHTLVVVDDCPWNANTTSADAQSAQWFGSPSIGGKGRLIAEFAQACGAKLAFAHYQAGWTGF